MWRRCVAIACHPLATTVDNGLQGVFSVGDSSRRGPPRVKFLVLLENHGNAEGV